MKNGVPFDVAFSWDDSTAMAACVAFGEMQGGTFDWRRGSWDKPKG